MAFFKDERLQNITVFKAIYSFLFLTANPLKKSDILLNVVFSGINNRNWFLNVVNLETNLSVQGIIHWTRGRS